MPDSRDQITVTTTDETANIQADGGAVLVRVTGADSWDGTIDFKASIDGTTYFNVPYIRRDQLDPDPAVSQISSPSTAKLYEIVGPLTQVQIVIGKGTTGNVVIIYRVLPASANRALVGVQGLSFNPDASEVKTLAIGIGATSASVQTALTPTSGKRVRLLTVEVTAFGLTTDPGVVFVYFGTGVAYTTNTDNAISTLVTTTSGTDRNAWFPNAGPVGEVNEVVSWRTQTETEASLILTLAYTEE